MPTKAAPTLSTVERLFDEIDEWYERVHEIRQKLSRLKRGNGAYLDLLPELLVETEVLSRKAQYAAEVLERFEDALPEDDLD